VYCEVFLLKPPLRVFLSSSPPPFANCSNSFSHPLFLPFPPLPVILATFCATRPPNFELPSSPPVCPLLWPDFSFDSFPATPPKRSSFSPPFLQWFLQNPFYAPLYLIYNSLLTSFVHPPTTWNRTPPRSPPLRRSFSPGSTFQAPFSWFVPGDPLESSSPLTFPNGTSHPPLPFSARLSFTRFFSFILTFKRAYLPSSSFPFPLEKFFQFLVLLSTRGAFGVRYPHPFHTFFPPPSHLLELTSCDKPGCKTLIPLKFFFYPLCPFFGHFFGIPPGHWLVQNLCNPWSVT